MLPVVPRALVALVLSLTPFTWGAADAEKTIRFDEEGVDWEVILKRVAEANGLSVRLEAPPGGRFTYHDPKSYTPAEALDLVHAALLDRGVTLIRTGGLLQTALLGDDMPWELVSFVPADRLDQVAPSEFVVTTLPLYSVSGAQLAPELELALSPRGRIIGNKVARRVVIADRAGVCQGIRDLVELIDPADAGQGVRLRIHRLQHARVKEVEPVLRELLGPALSASNKGGSGGGKPEEMPGPPGLDVNAVTGVVFNREFLSSFTPGYSLKGVGTEKPKEKMETRLTVDPVSNAVFVMAEADLLGKVDQVIAALDRPVDDGVIPIIIRSYPITGANADDVARRLRTLMAQTKDLSITGVDRTLIVRGTREQLAEIESLLATISRSDESLAGFRLRQRRAIDLVPQIERLFQGDGQRAPRVVADSVENALLIRGTASQVEQVRQLLADLGELTPGSSADPKLRVGGIRMRSSTSNKNE